jgi:hypothetical protein
MGIALQLLFTGLGVGSIYALVALGFVLIYRATNVLKPRKKRSNACRSPFDDTRLTRLRIREHGTSA